MRFTLEGLTIYCTNLIGAISLDQKSILECPQTKTTRGIMTPVKRINHIAIVVDEIEDALHFWRDALGLKVARVEEVPDQDSVVAFLSVGNMEIELVKPTADESGIARYIKKRGPGIHHICFEVDDIKASLESLKAKSVRLINSEPVIGTSGKRFAFIHPESTHGVLVELYELPPK